MLAINQKTCSLRQLALPYLVAMKIPFLMVTAEVHLMHPLINENVCSLYKSGVFIAVAKITDFLLF